MTGVLVNDDHRLASAWHPVLRSADLAPGTTEPVVLLGRRLTVSRDAGGRVHVPAARASCERYGLVWVALTEPGGDVPGIPELDGGTHRYGVLRRRTPASAGVIVDNFLDVTHFSYLHRQSFGRSRPVTADGYRLDVADDHLVLWHDAVLHEMRRTPDGGLGQRRIASYTYRPPFWAHLTMDFPADGEHGAATLVCSPESATATVVFVVVAVAADAEDELDAQLAFSRRVLEEDLVVLEGLRDGRLPLDLRAEQHTKVDRASVEFRRLLGDWLAQRDGVVDDDGFVSVATEGELDRLDGAPVPVRLAGEAWALVRLGEEVVALRDRCPHRRAPLSAGRVVVTDAGPALECGYHGWSFGPSGSCVALPALGDGPPPRGMAVEAAEVSVVDGVIRVRAVPAS